MICMLENSEVNAKISRNQQLQCVYEANWLFVKSRIIKLECANNCFLKFPALQGLLKLHHSSS